MTHAAESGSGEAPQQVSSEEVVAARKALSDCEQVGRPLTADEARIIGWFIRFLEEQDDSMRHLAIQKGRASDAAGESLKLANEALLQYEMALNPKRTGTHDHDPLTEAWLEMGIICDLLETKGRFEEHTHLGVPEPGDLMCHLCVAEQGAAKVRKILGDVIEKLPWEEKAAAS